MRVYITTSTVGVNFGICGQIRKHHPDCADHGELVAETGVRPLGFEAAAMNAAANLAFDRGHTVVEKDYQP